MLHQRRMNPLKKKELGNLLFGNMCITFLYKIVAPFVHGETSQIIRMIFSS